MSYNRDSICIDKTAVIIQARLSSQRIPKKMIKSFSGSNLTEIAINKIRLLQREWGMGFENWNVNLGAMFEL